MLQELVGGKDNRCNLVVEGGYPLSPCSYTSTVVPAAVMDDTEERTALTLKPSSVLWSCRGGHDLSNAVAYCLDQFTEVPAS